MTLYATLSETKNYMNANLSTDDTKLLGLIRQVSRRIDRLFAPGRNTPFFAPYLQTRNNYLLSSDRVNSRQGTFLVGDPLMALTGVGIGSQTLTPGTQVNLWQSQFNVYNTLALVDRCCHGWFGYASCQGCQQPAYVSISGIWGYNVDYAHAWIDTTQTITNVGGINASVTTFTVTDVDAANSLGLTPAISAGNLIQIESEWLEVTATNITTNTVTVRRGVNGSTAAVHAQGTAVATFEVDEQIKRAVYRQSAFEYAKIGSYDETTVQDLSTVTFAADVLAEFSSLLSLFSNF